MGMLVKATALCACSGGVAPVPLTVTSNQTVIVSGTHAATIMDGTMANLPNFGACVAPSNPAVIAAKAAGSPSAPCTPACVAWAPGSPTVLIAGKPALSDSSKLVCTLGGVISVNLAGQVQTLVP